MFFKDTIFVLGAGSSWHYGYPTGETLVEKVIQATNIFSSYCEELTKFKMYSYSIPKYVKTKVAEGSGIPGIERALAETLTECESLSGRLKSVRPLVIDHFLTWNVGLRQVGKLMIAAALFECQLNSINTEAERAEKKNDWYRFIVHKLAYGCKESKDLLLNRVKFITFNYDTSLEYYLHKALISIDLFEKEHVIKFLTENRILHMYGQLSDDPFVLPNQEFGASIKMLKSKMNPGAFFDPNIELSKRARVLDHFFVASENIRTIEMHDKDGEETSIATKWIRQCEVAYFMGFGFDEVNGRRLGLDTYAATRERPEVQQKWAYYTNFENIRTIEKRAKKLFSNWLNVESSERNVYQAIEKDFDALGSQ